MVEKEVPEVEVSLKLKVSEVNFILDALSKLPYVTVSEIITKVMTQGRSQVPTPEA